MKERKNIDELFRSGISGYRINPSEQAWQNIEKGFFRKKGFFFYKWYILAAALLLLITAGGILYYGSDNEDILSTSNEIIVQTGDEGNMQDTGEKSPVFEVELKTKVSEIYSDINNESVIKKEEITSGNNFSEQASGNNAIQYSEVDETVKDSDHLSDQNLSNDSEEISKAIYAFWPSKNLLSMDALSVGLQMNTEVNMIDPETITGMKEFLEKQRKSHFYTGAAFDGGMVYYPSTTDQFTWSAGISFGLTAGRFYVETGMAYQDMKERGIYTIDLQSYDSVGFYNEVESFEIDPVNPNEIIYNTKEVTVYDSIDYYEHTTPYFKYKYIDVPLIVGFKFFQKEKFTASVETGVMLSLMVEKDIPEAEYYNPDYTVIRIHNNTPERVDLNLLWQMGIRLNYRFYKSMSVSAEPVFTKYLNSIYDTEKGYNNVKPYSMGLRVGIYYGF